MADFVLTWDVETVPAFPDPPPPMSENSFPKLIYHSIVCIGGLAAFRTEAGWEVDTLGCQTVANQSESDLIRSFVEFIGEHQPQMVTFNGQTFDLPVLRYRAMIHGVAAPGLHSRRYHHRFTDDHVDLCDVLSSYSFSARAKLDEMSRVMGLPGKPDGIDGSQVHAFYEAGRINEIADYCVSDVLNTYRIWLRYELFRGRLTRGEFEFSDAIAQSQGRQPTTVASTTTPAEQLNQLPLSQRQANGSV